MTGVPNLTIALSYGCPGGRLDDRRGRQIHAPAGACRQRDGRDDSRASVGRRMRPGRTKGAIRSGPRPRFIAAMLQIRGENWPIIQ